MERNTSSTIMINSERSDLYNILRQISHNGMLVIIYQTKVQQQKTYNISQKLTEYSNSENLPSYQQYILTLIMTIHFMEHRHKLLFQSIIVLR